MVSIMNKFKYLITVLLFCFIFPVNLYSTGLSSEKSSKNLRDSFNKESENFKDKNVTVLKIDNPLIDNIKKDLLKKNKAEKDSFYGSKYLICIDPGHPSETSSGRWKGNGVTELEINWQVSKKLEKYLQEKFNLRTILTRTMENELTTNRRRAEIANENNAHVFLRLHCDSGKISGFTIYYPDKKGRKKIKDKNGKIKYFTGPEISVCLESGVASHKISEGMEKILKKTLRNRGVKGDSQTYIGGKQGALTGSIFAKVPALVVEMCYLNNKYDAEFIKSEVGQNLMCEALGAGIINYLKTLENEKKIK